MSAGALPQTLLGVRTALLQTPAGFEGPASTGRREGRKRGEGEEEGRRILLYAPQPWRERRLWSEPQWSYMYSSDLLSHGMRRAI